MPKNDEKSAVYAENRPEIEITPEMIEAGVAYASSQLCDMPMAFSDYYLRGLVSGILSAANGASGRTSDSSNQPS